MTIDNVFSCRVVTAEGQVLTASASEHQDLFWGLRGGGGNLGIVTSFEFRAHSIHTVLGGLLVYPRAAAIRHFRDFMQSAVALLLRLFQTVTRTTGNLPCNETYRTMRSQQGKKDEVAAHGSDYYGGAAGRIVSEATAYPHRKSSLGRHIRRAVDGSARDSDAP